MTEKRYGNLKFIGNCNDIIDWNKLIVELDNQEPDHISPRHEPGIDSEENVPGLDDVFSPLRSAGWKKKHEGGSASWDVYMPSQFDNSIIEKFKDFVGLKESIYAWISVINPGYYAPWHNDITSHKETLEYELHKTKTGEIHRYHCHIGPPTDGHVFIVEEECLYKQAQGNVYKWPDRKSWHGGANCGIKRKWLFNIFGI